MGKSFTHFPQYSLDPWEVDKDAMYVWLTAKESEIISALWAGEDSIFPISAALLFITYTG